MPHHERFVLSNRHGRRIVGLIDLPDGEAPLADPLILCHGYGGDKEGAHLRAIADAVVEAGIGAVRFDFTDGAGESDGTLQNASVAGYADDLEDVLDFVAAQPRFAGTAVAIGGHSYAGMVILLVAARRRDIDAVFFLSGVFDRAPGIDMRAVARSIRAPIYVVDAGRDLAVPNSHSEALIAAAGPAIAGRLHLPEGDHNYRTPGAARRVAEFVRDALLDQEAAGHR